MKRAEFLKLSGGLLAASAIPSFFACNDTKKMAASQLSKQFGLQLYTLRDVFPKDPKGVLKQVADFGYNFVESFEFDKGIYWGMSNKDFKKYLTDLGMDMHSSHCDTSKDFERKAAEAAEIGIEYLIYPYFGRKTSLDEYKKLTERFNELGGIAKKAGIKFAYHNHDYSFQKIEGVYPQDLFMSMTDASLVDFQMDEYWVVTAGEDPLAWMKKYPDRFKLCHIKDRKVGVAATETSASCNLGDGAIDYKTIVAGSMNYGMKYLVVEQELYDNSTSLKSTEANAQYMKKILS
jgi:sugar phosphate isomerase/epimerase